MADPSTSCDIPVKKTYSRKRENLLPQSFKGVARALYRIRVEHKSIRNAVYASRFRGQILKRVLGMTNSVMKNLPTITRIIDELKIPSKEPTLALEIVQVLVHEVTNDHPLPCQNKAVMTINKYKSEIMRLYSEVPPRAVAEIPLIPRYARVQTIITTVEDVMKTLQSQGFHFKILKDNISLAEYHEVISNLKTGEFVKDFHFPDLLVFASGENLSETDLYKKGHLFLHDKASYIPVHVLDPKPNSVVMDCCAAPGMKTAHIACLMKNTGQLRALDRNLSRFAELKKTLARGKVENCLSEGVDFNCIYPYCEPYSLIEYILVDPSCSGSGMIERMKSGDYKKDQDRIDGLSDFQIYLLTHALKFPNVKRVVYSTCSVHEEENELVVEKSLESFSKVFEVTPAFPEWPTRGLDKYSFGSMCVRAHPDTNLTNGFFVACISRIAESSSIVKKIKKSG